jgi:hypothetical protein
MAFPTKYSSLFVQSDEEEKFSNVSTSSGLARAGVTLKISSIVMIERDEYYLI